MHRGRHVFQGERVQAFSDAVFAIIATIMVIPLQLDRDTTDSEVSFELKSYLLNQYPKYLIYIFSYIMVLDSWYSHVKIFSIVECVDDIILWLNLLLLLFISFLPFGVGLVSEFQESRPEGFHLAIFICSLDIVFIGVTMIIILFYVYMKSKTYLHPEFANSGEIHHLKIGVFAFLLVNPILALLALLLSLLQSAPAVSLVFFYATGISTVVMRFIIYIYHWWRKTDFTDHSRHLFRTVANKVRTETFSDGVFSIVATLIVLDLTTDDIPTKEEVAKAGGLGAVLSTEKNAFASYVSSFIIVGLLWLVHHGMFHFIEKMTPALSLVNTLVLMLVCLIPFVTGINVIFAEQNAIEYSENGVVSVQAVAVVVFLVGTAQLLFWAIAWLQKDKCLTEEIDKYPAEILQFSKVMIFPIVSFIMFWATLSDGVTLHHVYVGLIITSPFLFLIVTIWWKVLSKFCTCKKLCRRFKRNSNTHVQGSQEKTDTTVSEDKGTLCPLLESSQK